jgi:hypothetical protein
MSRFTSLMLSPYRTRCVGRRLHQGVLAHCHLLIATCQRGPAPGVLVRACPAAGWLCMQACMHPAAAQLPLLAPQQQILCVPGPSPPAAVSCQCTGTAQLHPTSLLLPSGPCPAAAAGGNQACSLLPPPQLQQLLANPLPSPLPDCQITARLPPKLLDRLWRSRCCCCRSPVSCWAGAGLLLPGLRPWALWSLPGPCQGFN